LLPTAIEKLTSYAALLVFLALGWEIFSNSDPNRIDWIDWWFWARQNLEALSLEGSIVDVVMSPVQGLFGQSYPLNPYFNPLWFIAASVDDPVISHKLSSLLIYILYSVTIWLLIKVYVKTRIFRLLGMLVCLNLFFDIVPVTEIYPLPKSNFNYFQLMPPQNFLMILSFIMLLCYLRLESVILRVGSYILILTIAVLADPLYSLIYFAPIMFVISLFYILEIKQRRLEIVLALSAVGVVFVSGIFEYPYLLKNSLGRSVFNEYLFHHVKRHDDASFAFQNKQNLAFTLIFCFTYLYDYVSNRNKLSLCMFVTLGLFTIVGFVYLSTSLNLNYLPGLHAIESSVIPLYVISFVSCFERIVKQQDVVVVGALQWICASGFCAFVIVKLVILDSQVIHTKENFQNVPLLTTVDLSNTSNNNYKGSVSISVGTRGSDLSTRHNLSPRFDVEHVTFTQNNEHDGGFFSSYGRSSALISYWLNGMQTLEENNHMTNPFYLYLFRNLFMQKDDYYLTNLNLFTRPNLNLYPLFGVRELITDKETIGSEKFQVGSTILYRTLFPYNKGQYAPKNPIKVTSAADAVKRLESPDFDPKNEFTVYRDWQYSLSPSVVSDGQIRFSKNGIEFIGKTNEKTLHLLPVIYSNCLRSAVGNTLVRVNLILTGIIFDKDTEDRIQYKGPPFNNNCIKKDISDIRKYNLRDRKYPYPSQSDNPAIRRFYSSPWH